IFVAEIMNAEPVASGVDDSRFVPIAFGSNDYPAANRSIRRWWRVRDDGIVRKTIGGERGLLVFGKRHITLFVFGELAEGDRAVPIDVCVRPAAQTCQKHFRKRPVFS